MCIYVYISRIVVDDGHGREKMTSFCIRITCQHGPPIVVEDTGLAMGTKSDVFMVLHFTKQTT